MERFETSQLMDPGLQADRYADLAIADECRLNVLWWHGAAPGERALEIESPGLTLTRGLEALYRHVARISVAEFDDFTRGRQNSLVPGSFDLVTMYGHCPPRATLDELRRLLVPRGTLLVAAGNRWWSGRWRAVNVEHYGRTTDLRFAKSLANAGYADVCAYWVEPSLTVPRNLIPAVLGRERHFEAIRARELGGGALRSVAANAGLRGVLYPGLLFVATVASPISVGRI